MNKTDFIIQMYKLWKADSLPHFNIIYGLNSTQVEDALHGFIAEVISSEHGLSPEKACHLLEQGHPDVLTVKKSSPKGRPYRIMDGDFNEMLTSMEYRPLKIKNRFILVQEAESISYEISNKLLKVLEEPSPNNKIFFMAKEGSHFIKTLISRARTWHLRDGETKIPLFQNLEEVDQWDLSDSPYKELIQKAKELALPDLQFYLSKNKKLEEFFKACLIYMSNYNSNAHHKEKILSSLRTYQQQKPFNGSHNHVLAEIHQLLFARGA